MEVEIELKLSTQALAGPIIIEKLLPQLNVTIEQSEVELSNSYFDTLNRDFRKIDMGLRIRGCQHHYEQTLKTAGKGVAGLQQRPEYNVSLGIHQHSTPEKPDLSLFPADVWPSRFNLPQIQKNLICQFSTQFIRSVFLLTWSDRTQVELVWDRGQVLASGRSDAINEIELELKNGSVDILFNLGQQIAELMPVTIGLLSKAARGYRLMDETKSELSQKQLKPSIFIGSENDIKQGDKIELSAYLAKTLRQWQKMSLVLPNSHEANIQWGHELKYYLSLLEKIMQQLSANQPNSALQHIILSLHEILLSLEELQYEVVDNLTKAQQIAVEQGLRALVSDKKCIKVQLEIMQWLSKTR